jgi:hypothetical protein
VKKLLWKKLWTCCKTDYRPNEQRVLWVCVYKCTYLHIMYHILICQYTTYLWQTLTSYNFVFLWCRLSFCTGRILYNCHFEIWSYMYTVRVWNVVHNSWWFWKENIKYMLPDSTIDFKIFPCSMLISVTKNVRIYSLLPKYMNYVVSFSSSNKDRCSFN